MNKDVRNVTQRSERRAFITDGVIRDVKRNEIRLLLGDSMEELDDGNTTITRADRKLSDSSGAHHRGQFFANLMCKHHKEDQMRKVERALRTSALAVLE